jgi:hypothetical protein
MYHQTWLWKNSTTLSGKIPAERLAAPGALWALASS